jgi:bifunctional UDP-N-acetylglucosamine pyrophosphorylase / glucosamine-1-phosphate N-acetyltransferase
MKNNEIVKAKDKVRKERKVFAEKAYELIASGVVVRDPERLEIRGVLTCGKNVEIDINVIFEGDVVLGDGASIGANCILRDCRIGKGTLVNPFSLVEEAVVGEHSFIGPYGRIRPGTLIGKNVQIGNFVEVKNAKIASECRINHLSFIGDADLAEHVTLGAGTITCNHDGDGIKHMSIDKGAYIGSGCNLVAPLKINANSTIAAGSTITEDVPGNTLTIARARQVTIKSWKGQKYRKNEVIRNGK